MQTITFHDLGSQQTFKKKASRFCINSKVNRTGPDATAFDQICASDDDKKVTFYAFKPMELKFEEDREIPSFSLPQAALNITWEDQILFVATKKAFFLISIQGEIK